MGHLYSIAEQLARYFGVSDPSLFYYKCSNLQHGWYYRNAPGSAHALGKSFKAVQASTFWAAKKLPGRDPL